MSDLVGDALAATKALLVTLAPAPEPPPVAVWVYPNEYESIEAEPLPVLIVSEVINQPESWHMEARGRGGHHWNMEILAMLALGPLTNDRASAIAEQRVRPWRRAVYNLLSANLTLTGTALTIGQAGGGRFFPAELFKAQIGHIHWWTKVYWGIRFVVPVTQSFTQVMDP